MKTAVIYARYSSERQTEQSIEGQLRCINEYVANNDITVVDTYIDRAMTGTNDNRKAFQQMLKDSNKKAWDYVLVYKLDRFSRDKYETAIHRHTLKMNGVKLISVMENIPDTPEGIILESLLEGMNQYYSAELSQKVKRGMNESRLKGYFTGGKLPFGYKVINKTIEIDEDKAKIVKFVFEEYASGKIAKEIMQELNDKGINVNGELFTYGIFYKMLHNEKYIGIYRYNGQVYTNLYPRIISDELYNAVKAINESNRLGKGSTIAPYLLRGKIICGYCGQGINGDSGTTKQGKRIQYYNCNGRKYKYKNKRKCKKKMVQKTILENLVVDATIKILSSNRIISNIADLILENNKEEKTSNSIIVNLQKNKETIEKSIKNLISAIEQGIVSESTKNRLDELENNLQEIKYKIKTEETKKKQEIKKEDIIYHIKSCLKKEPRQMINLLIDKIILYNDKMEIKFKFEKNSPDESRDYLFYIYTVPANLLKDTQKIDEENFNIEFYM